MTVSHPRRPARPKRRRPLRRLFALALLAAVCFLFSPTLLERVTYKLEYRDLIEHYSIEQGLDPALVASMIYNESRFNPSAVSRVGARGLMQIMPETGAWLAGKFGEAANYTPDRLFDVNTNLRYGCWYLGYLARTFGGDVVKMAAGYHAGQGRVAEWLKDPAISPDGRTLPVARIPYPDTKQYVERVVKTHAIYRKLYWEN